LLGAASFAQSVAAEMLGRKLSRCIIFQWWSGLATYADPANCLLKGGLRRPLRAPLSGANAEQSKPRGHSLTVM
jgi:hypothetical protein